ncbi:DUF177 domain-containing protein [bacterium]|nr:MAG: DUF177 domain-containing protein [bacterium]
MLTFKINEIPDGKSEEIIQLASASLDLTPYEFIGGEVHVYFEKYPGLIRTRFEVASKVMLACDRSLEQFQYPVKAVYSVLFDANAQDVSEDDLTTTKPLDIPGNIISITEEVRDTILLQIPIKKLHPKFIDENGEELEFSFSTELSESESESVTDPRWEKLKSLKNNTN